MASLTNPAHIVLDNVALLAGSLAAFSARYHVVLSPTSFERPGNTASANALLHFLLCTIDADVAVAAFKPCFPILDREQERDFRRVVDERLSALEKLKLLPVGVGRKSVVAAAGGERFLDLAWSLSSLAVQQASYTPVYTNAARRRLTSGLAGRADSSLSQQSSLRSSRSLMSTTSNRDTVDRSVNRQRRFLSEGMLTANETRRREIDIVRNRIEMEKLSLSRTTQLGKTGVETWMLEAEKVREKIAQFEGKVRRLKIQLADMGFDQNGNDLRANTSSSSTSPTTATITTSLSRDDLRQLKTSPIESMESGSSVDELLEPSESCDDIAQHFAPLDSFTQHTKPIRTQVQLLDLDTSSSSLPESPKNLVQLVRAATDQLEEATKRMDEIEKAKKTLINHSSIEQALDNHKQLHQASLKLHHMASELTQISHNDIGNLHLSQQPHQTIQSLSPTIPKPSWLDQHLLHQSSESLHLSSNTARHSNPEGFRAAATEANLVKQTPPPSSSSKRSQNKSSRPHSTPRSHTFTTSRRLKESTKASERKQPRHARSNSASANPTSRSRIDSLHGTSHPYLTVKTPRSVRFAALPPSYSANRPIGPPPRDDPHRKASRRVPDMYANASVVETNLTTTNLVATNDSEPTEQVTRQLVSENTHKSESTRRSERKDNYVRRDLINNKPPLNRRPESVDDRSDGNNSVKGLRVPRTQTPRRVVRRKEIIQRSVLDISASGSKRSSSSSTTKVSRSRKTERTGKNVPASQPSKESTKGTPVKQSFDAIVPSKDHVTMPVEKEQVVANNEDIKEDLNKSVVKPQVVKQIIHNDPVESKPLEVSAQPPSAAADDLIEKVVIEAALPPELPSVINIPEADQDLKKQEEEEKSSLDVSPANVNSSPTPSETVEEANAETLSQSSPGKSETMSAFNDDECPPLVEKTVITKQTEEDVVADVDADDTASDEVSAVGPLVTEGNDQPSATAEPMSSVTQLEEHFTKAELPHATVDVIPQPNQESSPAKENTSSPTAKQAVSLPEREEQSSIQVNKTTAEAEVTAVSEAKETSRADIGSSLRGMKRGFTRRGNGSLRGSGSPHKSGSSRSRKKDASASNLSVHSSKDFPGSSGDQVYPTTERMLASRSGILPQSNSQRRLRGEGKKLSSPRRPSASASGSADAGRGSGKNNGSPSSRKSALKSLRARLAAVLK